MYCTNARGNRGFGLKRKTFCIAIVMVKMEGFFFGLFGREKIG